MAKSELTLFSSVQFISIYGRFMTPQNNKLINIFNFLKMLKQRSKSIISLYII